jgi:hypothetical protein
MVSTHLPAWCEQQSAPGPDGRYVVACYFTRDGHPVAKWRAERVQLSEYAPDGTLLRVEEGVVNDRRREEEVVFSASSLHFSH